LVRSLGELVRVLLWRFEQESRNPQQRAEQQSVIISVAVFAFALFRITNELRSFYFGGNAI
jgi:hypothetical protein